MSEIDHFYLEKEEPNKSCLLALRHIILSQDENISETKKYGMPCFCFKNKVFTYLWIDKKTNEPYILFVNGQKLKHKDLESGGRSKMKIFRINPNQTLQLAVIKELLTAAIKLLSNKR